MTPRSLVLPSVLALAFQFTLSPRMAWADEDVRDSRGGRQEESDLHEARPPLWTLGNQVRVRPFLATSPGGYSVAQIRKAYGFDKLSAIGAGQTIAIVDAYGSTTLQNDLNNFCIAMGIPSTTLGIYYPQGKPRTADSGWALETALDVQWAHAIAPGAKIVVVIAKSASISNLLGAVDYAVKNLGAKQVSMSWGAAEFSGETSYDSHFNKSGVSFFAASGDNGSGVIWPAASPYVVAVGGTTLSLDANGIASEVAWSGSGGGVSAYETKPTYQSGWQATTKRTTPDVSYNANPSTGFPVYISNYNGSTGWITVGGTSAGAPQWAALQALVNSSRTSALNGVLTAIYGVAGSAYSADFYDITVGNNGGYTTTLSYDYVTGLGSPNAGVLVPSLIAK
ncbi:MAG: S53 family peptidase [Verrucomicrobia bacterium]|nr:S53 family peptidase [Verrucomicrobiota bacterium]